MRFSGPEQPNTPAGEMTNTEYVCLTRAKRHSLAFRLEISDFNLNSCNLTLEIGLVSDGLCKKGK